MTNISYAINNEGNSSTQTTNENINPIKGTLNENNTSTEVNSNPNSLPLQAKYAVLLDYETGTTLYSKNGNKKLYPASTTKMWTAYMVLKNVDDLNDVIKIEDLPTIEGSSMYLKEGESFTVKQLLDALLVHSSNDAALQIHTDFLIQTTTLQPMIWL